MKVYFIWNNYQNQYEGVSEPTKVPSWYPVFFKSWEDAESYLMKITKKYYFLKKKVKLKTKRTYEFHPKNGVSASWPRFIEEYSIVEREMK